MNSKLKQLREFSDPEYVMMKAKQMGLNPVHESSRKDKKYMIFDGRRWFILVKCPIKMQLNIMIKIVSIDSKNEIGNGKPLRSTLLHGFHTGCCGDLFHNIARK